MASKRHALNVVGPFYVADGCCTACGVPPSLAPELFAEDHRQHCFVRKQPETAAETDAMLRVLVSQDLGCIRYGGADAAILRRLAEAGEMSQCDEPLPPDVVPLRRDHVSFVVRSPAWTARRILERWLGYVPRWRASAIVEDDPFASVSVAWFQDDYHRIDAFPTTPGRWVIRHRGPPRLSDMLHDWLVQDEELDDIRWQTRTQWEAGGPSQPTPW